MAIKSIGKVTVATAGTPVAVSSTSIPVCWVRFVALSANTGNIIPGDSTLDSATLAGAFHDGLSAGQPYEIAVGSAGQNIGDLAQMKVDATVNGESCLVIYGQT